ncbi:TonB-dependent receptor [Archangium primigenium]|uniref:TonB-dependent receptor n=1 Tax=[Archangium] primigenium TaxID=2792470 RepID=UPI001957C0C6|nr:TonB-dependent receptor [Archangium primigenium]MBM7112110.1 TonB-dependent receptor [Archangium primigenium]
MTTHRSTRGWAPLLVLLTLALLPASALAAGENYGRVSGYVYDPTGSALAEVPLTISGPALQQPISRTSGEDGRYEFDLLPPGEGYQIEVTVEGFTPLKLKNIAVRLGQTTPVDVKLDVFTETQAQATYEITERTNPIINPDSAQTGAVVTADKAAQTPIFTQPQGIAQLVAGVGPGTAPSSRGGISRWGKFYVDGMDTTDVSDGSITSTMNFYAVENFEIITGGLDAQYNALGVVQNIVTKTGSNRFTYDAALVLQPSWAGAKTQFSSNQPASTGGLLQNSSGPQPITTFYSPVLALGGPIVKDRLWFYLSGQMNFSLRETPLTINGVQENRPRDTRTNLARLKLTWQPTSRDRLSLAVNVDRNTISNNYSNANTSPEAESRIARGGYFLIANYDRNINDSTLFQLQTGFTYKDVYQGPQNDDLNAVAHVDSSTSFVRDSSTALSSSTLPGNYSTENRYRFQFDPTLLFKRGAHQMKAGIQVGYLAGDQSLGTTGNLRYLDRNGYCDPSSPSYPAGCDTRVSFYGANGVLGPNNTDASVAQLGAFVQDRWTVNRQLTVVAGLRADVGRLYGNNSTFITNLVGIGPRVSATYDVTNDRKTLLKAHYGRSNEMGDVFVAQRANPDLLQYSATFNTTTNTFNDCTPETPAGTPGCTVAGGANGRFFDKTHTPPSVDEVSLGLHREVSEGAVVGVDLTYRRYNNMWVDEEVNQIWDPSGTRVIGYVDPAKVNSTVYRIHNPSDAWRDYKGGDLWAQGKLGRWDLLASYTLAFNNGTVGSYFDGYGSNPRLKYLFNGPTPDDIRHTLKGAVGYSTPFGLDFNLRARYLTGTPLWQYQQLNSTATGAPGSTNFYRSPRGTGYAVTRGTANFNDPTTVSELRNPSQLVIDAQVRYDVGRLVQLGSNKMELMLLITNVLNNTDATAYYDQYSTGTNNNYGLVRSRSNGPVAGQLTLRFRN